MRATVFRAAGDVRIETVPDAAIRAPSDALVRVTHACVCGSDLWFYRGEAKAWRAGWRCGHEFLGIVEDVGPDVRTVGRGDRVIAPFVYSDGTCEFCLRGLQTSCPHGDAFGGANNDGGQGEAVRVPYADATLVALPSDIANDEAVLERVLPLSDVMGTGHHAALAAGVGPGKTVAVIGDGAVGLCAILAARRLGAERVLAFGRHPSRAAVARRFGAAEIVAERGPEAVARALELTGGGPHAVLECVGNEGSMAMATGMVRPGGAVGFVGVPYGAAKGINLRRMFEHNFALRGGLAPVRAYLPELLADVLAGRLDPSPVFDLRVGLDGVPQAYAAMNERTAIKALVAL